eukprot:gene5906-33478_t
MSLLPPYAEGLEPGYRVVINDGPQGCQEDVHGGVLPHESVSAPPPPGPTQLPAPGG